MSQEHADRNLLFGILALQMDFITREQLVTAMQAWVFDKAKPLGQILIELMVLDADTNALLEALVKKHLAQHGNDPQKSLGAVTSIMSVQDELKKVVDPDVQASLGHVGVSRQEPADPYATRVTEVSAAGPASVRPASSNAASGTALRFRIIRPHARGGLGEVHVARDGELNREVALKQIQACHADDRESQARFLLEAEITGGLEHPGIVPVYGLGQYADGRPFYAMRFIRGDSLKEAIEHFFKADVPGRDPGERSLELRGLLGRFVDVCNAIGYAHSRGVLHRDLKPGNVMLGKYGETLVVDWGLAKPLDKPSPGGPVGPGEGSLMPSSASMASQTLMGSAMGTPQFMSPEQAAGRLDLLGPASDVYSLGATLYAILTGLPPIQDTDVRVVLKKVENGQITPPGKLKDHVPKPLDAICMKAMALAIGDRYVTPGALADDVEHWLADEPVSAWREPWRVRARRWLSRHRTLVTTAAAVVLVATVSLAVASALLAAANERERAAHAEAAHNYDIARRAVDGYVATVNKDELLHAPGMEPLRKSLLEDASKFYEQFVSENENKPGVKAGLGRALYYLAQITGDIGDEREAIKLHLRAKDVLAPLAAAKPPDPAAETDLARCWHHLGRLYRLSYQLDKSEAAYTEALALWKKLAKEDPAKDLYRAELARSQLGLGNVYQVNRLTKKAEEVYAAARDARQKLADDHPKEAEYQRDLAVSLSNLASVFIALGQKDDAKAAYGKAIDIQKALVAGDQRVSQYQNDEARSYLSRGTLELDAGYRKEAEGDFKKAETIWRGLTKTHPAVMLFQSNLAESLSARAKVYSLGKGKIDEAVELCKRAIAMQRKLADDHKDVPSYRGNLARGYSRLGDVYRADNVGRLATDAYLKAVDILEKLARGSGEVPQFEGDLARTLNSLGLLYAGQPDEKKKAEDAYSKAIKVWEKLVSARGQDLDFSVNLSTTEFNLGLLERSNPNGAIEWFTRAIDAFKDVGPTRRKDDDIRKALHNAHWQRAETLSQAGRHRDALNDWNQALEAAGAMSAPKRLRRTVALARAGEHAEAMAEAEALEPEAIRKNSGTAFYELGRVYAICSAEAARDVKLAANQRQPTAEKYAEHSVELLKKARAAKYFQLPAKLDRLRMDSDFDPIRQQVEYVKLFE
jgi:eukaryotic-like serine/threonine-protein kinase